MPGRSSRVIANVAASVATVVIWALLAALTIELGVRKKRTLLGVVLGVAMPGPGAIIMMLVPRRE